MIDLRSETLNLWELQRAELRDFLNEYGDELPRMIRSDLFHLCSELTICINHLAPDVSDTLLARGTIE